MSNSSIKRYDDLPYHSAPYAETHPRTLRTLAALLDVDTAELTTARVLELGCASGGNLIPIAEELPQAQFVGIDLSQRHIKQAQLLTQQLSLKNVDFRQQSLTDFDSSAGEFDYIIAHGLFSWVPEPVRLHILKLCRELLAPRGVAVISYNAYPGCHARDQVRAMMQYHVANIDDPREQIEEAKSMLKFMLQHARAKTAHHTMLQETLTLLQAANSASYFYHDFLEDNNRPFYLHEFDALVRQQGLQLLCESRLFRWQACDLDFAAVAPFADLPYAEREQYIDYLRNMPFHSHVVCRDDVAIDRQRSAKRLAPMHLQWKYDPGELPTEPTPGKMLKFAGKRMKFKTDHGPTQTALIALGSQPARCFSFQQLQDHATACLGGHVSAIELSEHLYQAVGHDLLEVFLDPPRYSTSIGRRPRVANHARLEAAQGNVVTNRCHRYVRFDDLGRYLLLYLDGQHDRSALCRRVEEGIADGRINLKPGPNGAPQLPPGGLPGMIDETLTAVSNSSMLVD